MISNSQRPMPTAKMARRRIFAVARTGSKCPSANCLARVEGLPNAWCTRTDDELIVFANVSCAVFLYHLNGWNLVRVATKIDPAHSADKDWFSSFVTSMLISSEHDARQKLGLPSLFTDGVAPLRHASFMVGVAKGQTNPLFEWERSYRRKHREES